MNIHLIVITCLVFLTACTTSRKKEPGAAPPSVSSELAKAEIEFQSRAYNDALNRLSRITNAHSNTDAADDAFIMMGKIYCLKKDYQRCYRSYVSVIDSEYSSPRIYDASLGASQALLHLGRYDEALSLTDQALRSETQTSKSKYSVHEVRFEILKNTGDRVEALRTSTYLLQNSPDSSARQKYSIFANEIIESNLSPDELKKIADSSDFGSYQNICRLRLGKIYFEEKDYSKAEDYLSELVSAAPESDLSIDARGLLQQIEARRYVNPLVIGAVLPLSGKYSGIGYKTLYGLQLGLGVAGPDQSNFKLAVIDSEGNADTAKRAAERLVIEDSAIAIIGDISSRTAEAVAQKSEELGVPNINLSQKSGLTDIGPFVFRNALSSRAITKNLVSEAMDKQGLRKFAILYPNDPYGIEYANLFWDEVESRGGEVRAAQFYPSKNPDLRGPIKRAVGTFYVEPRQAEMTFLLKNWYDEQKHVNSRTEAPSDLLPPITEFEAVFVPDSVRNLAQVASMFLYNDVSNIRLLGTNLWNSPDLVKSGTRLVENSIFVDAQSSNSLQLKSTKFYQHFKATFGYEPSVFEAQAYDTGLALRQLISSGQRSRHGLRDALENLKSFSGALGSLGIDEKREFSRPLTTMTVRDGQITQL